VIAHRGASGVRPEHTIEAYRLGIEQGADFIEPDLVVTRDGVLVARHENEIGQTTDVSARTEFAARRTTKLIDGAPVEGWFTEDFTLAELKTLRARERLPQLRPANTAFDGRFEIPTFAEVCALAQSESARLGRAIGVYPETKHPSYFARLGLSFDDRLVADLTKAGLNARGAPVFIQSFEVSNLQRLRARTQVGLVQLIAEDGAPFDQMTWTYADMVTDSGLATIARYADAIGPQKTLVFGRDAAGAALPASDLVRRAHARGLKVHPWTFRDENMFLPTQLRSGGAQGDPAAHGLARDELEWYFEQGVDAVFTDFPATADAARTAWCTRPAASA
jgi:glycerophosphoryl diester phosphodiesterase